ncbi:unnamed protein product, partial [Gulo gulo]
SLHALPNFLLAKGIALSERKVLRAEWNLPENALLFRVRRMEVGVGQKLNAAVGIAERTQTPRQRRERSRKGWPGPAASTTLRAPREERPPGPALQSPPPLRRRGREKIRLTAKRSKRDPRN